MRLVPLRQLGVTTAVCGVISLALTGCQAQHSQVSTCRDTAAVASVEGRSPTPLLDCSGSAGVEPLPTVRVKVGEQIRLTGSLARGVLSSASTEVVHIDGFTVTPASDGTALIAQTGVRSCAPDSSASTGQEQCSFFRVVVVG
jgi:hypothetical protein